MNDARREIERMGIRVVFKNHELVKECVACYNVVVNGKAIIAASWLDIPTGEIWLSEYYQEFSDYILFHELQEIKYRASGHDPETAHLLALEDECKEFAGDPKWEKLRRDINVCSFDMLLSVPGIGGVLAHRIVENRPYSSLREIGRLRGIGPRRYATISRTFWCAGDRVS